MATKATWLFQGRIDNPSVTYGFSETWYTNLTGDNLVTAMDTVSDSRAQSLADFSSIIGYRIQGVNGRAYVVKRSYPAPAANGPANVQVDAALMQCFVQGSPTVKKFYMHNLPDSWVNDGVITQANRRKLTGFIAELQDQGFLVRYRTQTAPQADILSVTAAGVVTTIQNIAVNVGDEVQFLRTRDTDGHAIRGTYIVSVAPGGNTFTVAHWPNAVVGRSGKIRKLVYGFGQVLIAGDAGFLRVGGKKVGRPFFQFRGRAPIRR